MKIGIFTSNTSFLSPVTEAMTKHGHQLWAWTQTGNQLIDWINLSRLLEWCDLAFFDWAQSPFLEAMSMENIKCKIVVRPHGMEFFSIYRAFPWRRVDLVVGPADIIGRALEELPPEMRPQRYLHNPVGSDPAFFQIPKAKKYGRSICMHSTTIRFRKRVYTTIQSFYDLLQHDENWRLHIGGEWKQGYGPSWEGEQYTGPCNELIEDLGIATKINKVGNLSPPEWRDWLTDKDIFISNGIREGVHVSLVDAMMSGVYPLINCWRGSSLYYPKENIFNTQRKLVDKILEWRDLSDDRKRELSQEARSWAVERFDAKLNAEKLVLELETL